MRKLMVLMTLVLVVVAVGTLAPNVANAKSACDVAAGYGWHSDYHNFQCYVEIMMDNWMLQKTAPVVIPLPNTTPAPDEGTVTIALDSTTGQPITTDSGFATVTPHLLL